MPHTNSDQPSGLPTTGTKLTVRFRDDKQDFLEWDIDDAVVVDCRPFQADVWKGYQVINKTIAKGDILQCISPKGSCGHIMHAVERVTHRS